MRKRKKELENKLEHMTKIITWYKETFDHNTWLTSKQIWYILELNKKEHNLLGDIDTIDKFRQGLRVLAKIRPEILLSRRVRLGSEFLIVDKDTAITTQTEPLIKPSQPDASVLVKNDSELERMRAVLRDVNRKYKAALNTNIFEQRLIKTLVKDIKALPPVPVSQIQDNNGTKLITTQYQDEEYILVISDSHAGEVVSETETLGLGGYNFSIFVQRLETLYKSILSLHTSCLKRKASKLWVLFDGDIISGEIHDELAKTNDAPVSLVVAETAYVYSQFLRDLSAIFPSISVICVAASNHPRLTKAKPFKHKWNNWDYLVHRLMSAYCSDLATVEFEIPMSPHWIGDINNKTYLITHGDAIQSWMGIPWYGINRMMWKLKALYAPHGQVIENVILGHFHVPGSIADVSGEIYINGSFKGTDEFSIGKMGTGTFPGQWYLGTHPERGITSRYLLRLNREEFTPKYKYKIEVG